jgi:multicomponent Na+:H+ antiporter subunit B
MTSFLVLDVVLLTLAVITAIAVVEIRNLLNATLLATFYSLLMSIVWSNMDAVDVAFTEAAVGAGITTILFIGTVALVGKDEKIRKAIHWPALITVVLTGAALVYGTLDMPAFGDPKSPVHTHQIAKRFTAQSVQKDPSGKSGADHAAAIQAGEIEPPGDTDDYFDGHVYNQVTTVIVTYRAFDTMFEVAVILAAGFAMILLLRGRRGNPLKGGLL